MPLNFFLKIGPFLLRLVIILSFAVFGRAYRVLGRGQAAGKTGESRKIGTAVPHFS
jgi:hypothetical protein